MQRLIWFRASRATLVVFALVAIACGESQKSDVDAASKADAFASTDAAIDGSAAECAVATECPCFSNADCPDAFACTSQDDTGENVFCIEGPRGAGVAGSVCADEGDCESALCIEAEGGMFCSRLCENELDDSCPTELPRCLFIGFGVDEFICAPPAA